MMWDDFIKGMCKKVRLFMGVLLASGMMFGDKLVDYLVLSLLITYFKEDSSESTAILVMIQDGLASYLEIIMSYISNALFSRFQVISVSSLFYISGLLLLYLASDGILNFSAPNIIGILLLSVGQAGVQPLIREFVVHQFELIRSHEQNKDDGVKFREGLWCFSVTLCSAFVSSVVYHKYASGPTTLIFSMVATGIGLILFWLGAWFYTEESSNHADTCRRRFTTTLRKLAAFVKRLVSVIYSYISVPAFSTSYHFWPLWLDIYHRKQDGDSTPSPEQETKRKRKIWKRWWTTFLLFGLVLSGGWTFFPYQGENMNHSKFLSLLVVIKSISCDLVSIMFNILLSRDARRKDGVKLVRIWFGMLIAIPCFLVARHIEVVRLRSETTIFWLVPQFCMLGLMEGLANQGLDEFMIDLFSESRKEYVSAFNTFVIGSGRFANILLFSIYSSSFSETTEEDDYHLPMYFLILTIVSSVNLCYYSGISIYFYYKTRSTPGTSHETAPNEQEGGGSNDETADQVLGLLQGGGPAGNIAENDPEISQGEEGGSDGNIKEERSGQLLTFLSDILPGCF